MGKVSIIIPVYNGEHTIEQTIDSALHQSYGNVQIVVINDGSKDKTADICNRLAQQNPNITLIHQKNGGVSAARNTGLDAAEGKYIAFLDADDIMDEFFCEKMIRTLEDSKAQMAVCGYYRESEKHIVAEWRPGHWSTAKECAEGLIKTGGIYPLWNKLFLKEMIQNKFNLNKNMGEDLEFVCQYMRGIEKTVSVSECLYHYQLENESSLSHTVKMTPVQILEEYKGLKSFVDDMNIHIAGFENRLVFSTVYKLKSESYKIFKDKWKLFRRQNGFAELVASYAPSRFDYKIMAFLIKYNMSLLMYLIMKVKL